jgi:hypothetical protein
VLLGVAWAGLNALKPLQIDDTAYFHYARQFATHPLDPYGFSIYWYNAPEPANEVLAPPVFPATWAIAMRLGPDSPWAWKLQLAPWAVLFVFALDALLRRFAAGMETPLLLLSVASPAFLPALNLMLDVPALALGLAAVVLFLRGCDRDSLPLAVSAGLVAGIAMQTKYTAFLVPAAHLVAAGLWRRWRLGIVAVVAAAQVFLSWELLMAVVYSDSHFLLASSGASSTLEQKLKLVPALFGQVGGLLPGVLLLAFVALGASGRTLWLTGAAVAGAYVIVALRGWAPWHDPHGLPIVEGAVFGVLGLTIVAIVPLGFFLLLESDASPSDRRDTLFLIGWLGLEVLGYFALSPFPAARRVLGIAVVAVLLAGRLAARQGIEGIGRRVVAAVVGSAVLGGLFALVDYLEASAQQSTIADAVSWVKEHGGGRVWYLGHWGFQFDAERAGMEPLVAMVSEPGPGDWIVAPDSFRVHCPPIDLDNEPLEIAHRVVRTTRVPLRTIWQYYCGWVPIEAHSGPRLEVTVYRVRAAFVPRLRPD